MEDHALAIEIAKAVQQAGGRAMIVGGGVRDDLLGLPTKDLDLEVYGLAADRLETLLAAFGPVHCVGRQFAVLHLATPRGTVEVSLPRTESKTGPGHKGFTVHADPDLDFRQACRRRDFTVNAMLRDPLTGELVDPFGGQTDLRAGRLRHVSPAFAEDPLRVLRAVRFAARFGWQVAPQTAAFCRSLELAELPRERIEAEWKGWLASDHPGHGLRVMESCGVLRFFPELQALRGVPQDPVWHPEGDVLEHTALCLDAAVQRRSEMEDPWLEMFAVLCHDLGKTTTTVFERGRWRSPAHDHLGADLANTLWARVSPQAGKEQALAALVREHLRPSQLYFARDRVSDAAIRRLSLRVDLPALGRVAWADAAGRSQAIEIPWAPETWLLQRAEELGVRDGAPSHFLRGADLLARGQEAGVAVGKVLAEAYELQLEGQLTDRSAALRWLDQRLGGKP